MLVWTIRWVRSRPSEVMSTRPPQMAMGAQRRRQPRGQRHVPHPPTFGHRHVAVPHRPLHAHGPRRQVHIRPLERHHFATPEPSFASQLEPGSTLLFSWTSNGLVHYELHSEPDGAPSGFSESYDTQDDRNEAHGSFAALFAGIHGWYWENRTEGKVTIKLTTAGFYSESLEFRSGMDVVRKQFQ